MIIQNLKGRESFHSIFPVNKNNPKDFRKMLIFFWTRATRILLFPSSSSCRAASMDLPDPVSPPVSIVHRSREVLKAISFIDTELFGSSNLDDFVMGGRWPYSCCFVGCCLQDLFNIARYILVQFFSNTFS